MHTRLRLLIPRAARPVRIAVTAAALLSLSTGAVARAAPGGSRNRGNTSAAALQGEVLDAIGGGFQLQPVQTWPVSVLLDAHTTVTLADLPGSAADIQDGRFVVVTGRYDQARHAVAATRVNVVVPTITGRVSAVTGATFSMGVQCTAVSHVKCVIAATTGSVFTMVSPTNLTYRITTSPTTKIVRWNANPHRGGRTKGGRAATDTPIAVKAGDPVIVQAFPPRDGGGAITAVRIWVGTPPTAGR